jgi:hypothetical protein
MGDRILLSAGSAKDTALACFPFTTIGFNGVELCVDNVPTGIAALVIIVAAISSADISIVVCTSFFFHKLFFVFIEFYLALLFLNTFGLYKCFASHIYINQYKKLDAIKKILLKNEKLLLKKIYLRTDFSHFNSIS